MKSIIVLALLLMIVRGGWSTEDDVPRTFCGRTLANARMLYCYNHTEKLERDEVTATITPKKVKGVLPWKDKKDALALTASSRFKRDYGLATECCMKPCYIDELLTYC